MSSSTSPGTPSGFVPGHRQPRWLVWGAVLALAACCFVYVSGGLVRTSDSPAWIRSAVSLKQIGLAMQNYHETFGHLPPAVVTDKEGKPLYSWRVTLLPFLEYEHLHKQFKLDEAWDSPHNSQLLAQMPKVYHPALGGDDPPGKTRYQVFVGAGTAFERPRLTWDDFPDGRANTLLVVEAGVPVPWSKPDDLRYDPELPLPALGGAFTREIKGFLFPTRQASGFVACFADGATYFVPHDTDEATQRGFITRDGGERVHASRLK